MVNHTRSVMLALVAASAATSASAQNRTVHGHSGERIPSTSVKRSDLGRPGMRIRLSGGQTNLLYFRPAGGLDLYVNRTGSVVRGAYSVDDATMCVTLPVRGRDCWPYDGSVPVGQSATIMSDRGQRVTVTYLAPYDEVVAGMSRVP